MEKSCLGKRVTLPAEPTYEEQLTTLLESTVLAQLDRVDPASWAS